MRKGGVQPKTGSGGAKAAFGIVFTIFAIYALIVIFMLVWAFLQTLKTHMEFLRDKVSLPKDWLFSNYSEALGKLQYNQVGFGGLFFNSIWYSVGSAVLGVFMHCLTGYAFAKYKFYGKNIAFSFILFTLAIPIVGSLPSLYKITYALKLNDSPLFLLTALGGFGPNFLIMYAFFKSVDKSYMEAAYIDGAGELRIFLRIMLPLAAGPFLALSIVGVVWTWNNYETPILFLKQMPTLSSGLYHYRIISRYEHNEPGYLAGALVALLPVLALVSVFGHMIMKNMTMGGLKG